MAKKVYISLANKCQLLFGLAVVLILTAALAVGGLRMRTLVREGQQEAARRLAEAWLAGVIEFDPEALTSRGDPSKKLTVRLVNPEDFETEARGDPFLREAGTVFESHHDRVELFRSVRLGTNTRYRYARAIRRSDFSSPRALQQRAEAVEPVDVPAAADPLEKILLIDLDAALAGRQLLLNRVYLVAAGLFAGLLAIGVFWFITRRIILSPVRVLRETAAKVSGGDIHIRSDINTGDEFEQLSDAFNSMLENLKENQDELRSVNKSLDLKLGELAQTNLSLYEANKIKGEFLANVSHELRTPLNSIIGFAEVLEEVLSKPSGQIEDKHRRYVSNIIISSRRLLDLINDLLDLAKIEAGRMDLRVAAVSVADSVEGLITLMKPQAEKGGISLQARIDTGIPLIQTDASKFQQILFNLLSNAVKFTPPQGRVSVEAKPVPGRDAASPQAVCISVTDTGPGIPIEHHEEIFEKFTQLDSSVTRRHSGTGLGLAISRELAALLQGRIELASDTGRGATFSLILPISLEDPNPPLMPPSDVSVAYEP